MSFSAEMKDFLTAYKTGQSINASRTDQDYKETQTKALSEKAERDNDPETLKLATAQAKATLANTQQNMGLRSSARVDTAKNNALSREIATERLRQLKLDGQDTGSRLVAPLGAIQPGSPAPQPVPGGAPVLDDSEAVEGVPVERHAEGGLVPRAAYRANRYVEGGLVDDDTPDESTGVLDTEEESAIPVSAQPTAGRGIPRGLEGVISPALVQDAAREGMTFGVTKAGLHQAGVLKSPAAILKAKQIAQGMGGLTEQEMQAARQAVDPEGKMSDAQRNAAVLGSTYQFWANKGDIEKAQRVAFQTLQYYRGASQRYAAIAAKAAEGGNVDLAMKAALKAYANVPDGNDLEIMKDPDDPNKMMYAYTGPDGKVISKGLLTPQQLYSSAMGLATGGFEKALLSAAGAAQADAGAVKTGGGGKTQSAGDRAKESETIGGEIEKMKTAWTTKNKDKPVDEEQWNEIGNAAQHIYQQNPKATANEVARAAHAMLNVGDTAVPEDRPFKIKPGEDGKSNTIDFGRGNNIKLDGETLKNLIDARTVKENAAIKKMQDDQDAKDKPGFVDKAVDAVGNIGGILADDANKFAGEVKGAVGDETAARVGSAVKAGGRAATDALAVLTNPNINFGTMSTAFKDKTRAAAQAVLDKLRPAVTNSGALPVDEADRRL